MCLSAPASPVVISLPLSPTEKTQSLSPVQASFPASASELSLPPVMVQLPRVQMSAWETTTSLSPDMHDEPVLSRPVPHKKPDGLTPQMRALFRAICGHHRRYLERIPLRRTEQQAVGIMIDRPHPQSGRTPLTMALTLGYVDLAIDLLSLGADPKLCDRNGIHPSARAAGIGKMAIEFFMQLNIASHPKATASTNIQAKKSARDILVQVDQSSGHTLMTWAIRGQHDRLVGLLIKAGAAFQTRDQRGIAPLEEACRTGSAVVVRAMLESWPSLVEDQHRSFFVDAIRGAVEADRPAVLALLLSFFREEYRASQSSDDTDPIEMDEVVVPSAQIQQDAYQWFFGERPAAAFTLETALRRTHDDYLLTPKESRLLALDKMETLAIQRQFTAIRQIIAAHARLR